MSTDLGLTLQDVAFIHRHSGIQEKEVLLPVSQSDEQSRQLVDGGREEEGGKEGKTDKNKIDFSFISKMGGSVVMCQWPSASIFSASFLVQVSLSSTVCPLSHARQFLKVAKGVHRNQPDNHCNQSDTRLPVLLLELY